MAAILHNHFQIHFLEWQGENPLSEPMMIRLATNICVTRPQWFNWYHRLVFSEHGLLRADLALILPWFNKNTLDDLSRVSIKQTVCVLYFWRGPGLTLCSVAFIIRTYYLATNAACTKYSSPVWLGMLDEFFPPLRYFSVFYRITRFPDTYWILHWCV